MVWNFSGNINGTVTSVAQNLPNQIDSFSIVNKAAGATVFNVYKITTGGGICISPLNKSLAASEIYEVTRGVVLLATEKIKIQTSGSVDYDFTISNLQPE